MNLYARIRILRRPSEQALGRLAYTGLRISIREADGRWSVVPSLSEAVLYLESTSGRAFKIEELGAPFVNRPHRSRSSPDDKQDSAVARIVLVGSLEHGYATEVVHHTAGFSAGTLVDFATANDLDLPGTRIDALEVRLPS